MINYDEEYYEPAEDAHLESAYEDRFAMEDPGIEFNQNDEDDYLSELEEGEE